MMTLTLPCHQGKDDLRQDAVMQQVFEMVNDLLQRDTESSRRHLKVRTYKVRMAPLYSPLLPPGLCTTPSCL